MGCDLFHSADLNVEPETSATTKSILKRRVSFSDANSYKNATDTDSSETVLVNPSVTNNVQTNANDVQPSNSVTTEASPTRIFCEVCGQYYQARSYHRHLLTVKHLENFRKSGKNDS